MSIALDLRQTPQGLLLPVLVVPGASKQRIVGLHDGRLKLAVNAPPEKGKANQAVIELLAESLGLKKSQLSVVKGETQRRKEILMAGIGVERILERLKPFIHDD